jgi:hypothetical protein
MRTLMKPSLILVLLALFVSCSSERRINNPETSPASPIQGLWDPTTYQRSVLYCAKIYGDRIEQEDAVWLARNVDAVILGGEQGDKVVDYLKSLNPDLLSFRYFHLIGLHENDDAGDAVVGYDFVNHYFPEWFLLDGQGQRFTLPKNNRLWTMDVGQIGWRAYWTDQVLNRIAPYHYDGLMGDFATIDIRGYWAPNGLLTYNDSTWQIANEAYLDAIHQRMNFNGLAFVANTTEPDSRLDENYIINTRIHSVDGTNQQGFGMRVKGNPERPYVPPDKLVKSWDIVEAHAQLDKFFVAGAQPQPDPAQVSYCIGCYLMCKDGDNIYFNVDWVSDMDLLKMIFQLYGHILNYDYGQPVGKRYFEAGYWKRDFTNGTAILDLDLHLFTFLTKRAEA